MGGMPNRGSKYADWPAIDELTENEPEKIMNSVRVTKIGKIIISLCVLFFSIEISRDK